MLEEILLACREESKFEDETMPFHMSDKHDLLQEKADPIVSGIEGFPRLSLHSKNCNVQVSGFHREEEAFFAFASSFSSSHSGVSSSPSSSSVLSSFSVNFFCDPTPVLPHDHSNLKRKAVNCTENEDDQSRSKRLCTTRVITKQSEKEEENKDEDLAEKKRKPLRKRGSANDRQSIYSRKRRERINERLRILQQLVPNGTRVDISTMLEQAIRYVKFMQLQIKLLSSEEHWMYAPLAFSGRVEDIESCNRSRPFISDFNPAYQLSHSK